ncbi:MAG: hypothetical protein JWR07_4896 [Nevskia sp.]|nr:hypothetical protein [Nevskia sp.]
MAIVQDERAARHGTVPAALPACRPFLVAAALLSIVAFADDKLPEKAPDAAITTSELAPVIVNGRRNPLDEADQRLKALKESLPGTDTPRKRDFADWYQAHSDPNALPAQTQALMLHVMGKDRDDVQRQAP